VRSVQVLTNETCDLACSFCDTRRPHERASVAGPAALAARIDAVRDCEEILLSGGEPTLRRDLPHWVRRAARRAERVVVETHAANIDGPRAQALADAGLHAVRVHLPAVGAHLDAITTGEGVWAAVLAGIAALQAARIDVEVTVPIVAANLDAAAMVPRALAEAGVIPTRLWIRVPLAAPNPMSLASRTEIAAAIETLATAARHHGIAATLDPATFIPPCQLRQPRRLAYLYRLNPGTEQREGYARTEACGACTVADRCPGLPLDAAAFADAQPTPLSDDRTRRRLTQIASPQAQAERELVTRELYRRPDGSTAPAHIIRVNFRCNQACTFCFVSTHLPAMPDERIAAAVLEAAALGAVVVVSGGEPTLNPRLEHWVRLAKAHGAPEVELQTNAIRLADPGRAARLATAGVDRAFVSLHAADAATSDALTHAPGTYAQTLAGLDALARTPIAVRINYVLCRPNAAQFPAFMQRVAQRWPDAGVTVSFVGMSTDLVPRTRDLVPRYSDVLPALADGLTIARAHNIDVNGFDSMCGIPLCLVPGGPEAFRRLAPPPDGYDGGEFVHPPPCASCSLRPQCFGLRQEYARLYGWDELRPVDGPAADRHT